VVWRRRGLSENENDRRHQGIVELNVVGIKPMGADERHAIRQIVFEGRAVVDVHELRGDEPSGVAAVLHPRRGEQEEVDVQTGHAVDFDTGHLVRKPLQAFLALAVNVMVADIGRVGQDEVGRGRANPMSDETSKVAPNDLKGSVGPQVPCGLEEGRIEFDADGACDALRAEHREHRREEAAGTDCGIGEADTALTFVDQRIHVPGDVDGEGVGRGELAEAIPLGRRLGCVDGYLNCLPACLGWAVLLRVHAGQVSSVPSFRLVSLSRASSSFA
jgi:hypothetical protein